MPSFMSISARVQELFRKNRGGRDKPPGGQGLTRALPGGGGETAPCPFPSIVQKRKSYETFFRATKLSEPLPTSILYVLTKGKFHTYDRSAVSNVKVTSCSAIFGQK